MAFLDGLVAFLQANTGVTTLIADRLQGTRNTTQPPVYPYTVFYSFENPSDYSYDLKVGRNARVQFDHVGNQLDIVRVGTAFKRALDTFVGLFPDGTRIISCRFDRGIPSPTAAVGIDKLSQDFLFEYADQADQ